MSFTMKHERNIGLDITRIFAFLFVPAVHFFLNSGYYDTPVLGKRMYLMTILRTFFMVCVPLFMLLTGYLMIHKNIPIEKKSILKNYSKLSSVLITYILATSIILLYRVFFAHEIVSFHDCFFDFFGFRHYSWYVNMYLGFYLLIPFLNALWKAIETKSGHLILLAVMLTLSVAPSLFNITDFNTSGALARPWLSTTYTQIVPNWWSNLYPFTYYFIGAYLKTHVELKKLNSTMIFLCLTGCVSLFGFYNIWRSHGVHFVPGPWSDWGSFQNTVDATLVFLFFNSIRYRKPNIIVGKTLKLLADISFGAYLLSWIPDTFFYPRLIKAVPSMIERLNYFPLMVAITIVISLLLSLMVFLIAKGITKLCAMVKARFSPVLDAPIQNQAADSLSL